MLGLFLCIVGSYATGGLMMFAFPIKVDTQVRGADAVGRSWSMLKGDWLMAALFYLVIGVIAGSGATIEAIGGVFTLPFLYVAQVHLYNRYTGHYTPAKPQHGSPYPRPGPYVPPNQNIPGAAPQSPQQPGQAPRGPGRP